MKYISHIKELVSGIIVNDLVTKDTEGYNALVALKNHLESLEEVYKYMPYKDPGPVIQNLEHGLAQANTRNQELRKQALYLNEEIEQKTKSRDQCYKYWQEYKSKYETLDQKHQDLKKKFQDLNDENAHHIDLLDQNHQAIENYQDLKEELEQKNSYIEDLKKQTSDAQCDLDEWINYKGPDLEYKIGILEQKLRIAESIFIGEQETKYKEQTNPLDIPGNKTLLDKKQDEIGFLLSIISEDQLEEYQEYLRTQLPDDQPQHHKGPKPKKRRITNR